MSNNFTYKLLFSLGVFTLLASIAVYRIITLPRISEKQAMDTYSIAVVSSPQSELQQEEYANGIRKFAKMFAKQEAFSESTDHSLLGPSGRYDEVYIGKQLPDQ